MMRVRFAPSPTGNLHIGSVRTALFNWVFAKKYGAKMILRIEDTDRERSRPEFEANILEGLAWMGLSVDEGPLNPEGGMSYRQSERINQGVYKRIAEELVASGHAYYGFESEAELEAEKAAAIARGEAYKYSRKSLQLSGEEINARLRSGVPYTIRFMVPEGREILVKDLIRGDITFETDLLSDFVMMKSDGSPSYNFAVVVDDIDMGITQVIRGEDHISNTPRQILVYEALKKTPPQFAHLPIILGPDRAKLSKRHGAQSVSEYRDQGYLPEALLNYLSLLGWSSPDGVELMTQVELIEKFTIERVSKSGAIFDLTKLNWMNGQYIRKLSQDALFDAVIPFLSPDLQVFCRSLKVEQAQRMVFSIKDHLETLADAEKYLAVYTVDHATFLDQLKTFGFSEAEKPVICALFEVLSTSSGVWDDAAVQQVLDAVILKSGLPKGKVFKPVRMAVSMQPSGPNLLDLFVVFGRDEILRRVAAAYEKIGR